MPLVNCPDCKKEISDQAASCIHCGRPIHIAATIHVMPDQRPPRKDPGVAALLSLLLPGLGQIYVGRIGWGILIALLTIPLCFVAVGFGLWLLAIFDAARLAAAYNKAHGYGEVKPFNYQSLVARGLIGFLIFIVVGGVLLDLRKQLLTSRSSSNPSDELQSYWQNDLKLVTDQLREDREGRLEWNGEVKNIGTRTIKIAKVWIKLRDREGQIVQDKEEYLVRNVPFGPGQVKNLQCTLISWRAFL